MKIFKLIVAGTIVLGVLIELVIRLFFPVPMEPGATLLLTNEIPGLKPSVRFEFDGDQLRKKLWSKGRRSEDLRVLCFGGNATTSIIQGNEDTWWGVLSSELARQTGKKVEVAALAHSKGGQIISALSKAELILDKYEVDLIICSFGFGDAMGFYGDYAYDPGKLSKMRDSRPKGFKYSLAKASHVLRMVRNGRTKKFLRSTHERFNEHNYLQDQLEMRRQYASSLPIREGIIRTMRQGDDPLREYIDGINGFISLAAKHKAKLIVLEEPTVYTAQPSGSAKSLMRPIFFASKPGPGEGNQVSPLAAEQELQRFFDAGRNKCESAGIQWLSLEKVQFPESGNFVSETYMSDNGSRALALGILPVVIQTLKTKD
ncbi:MAG: hypothetical protein VYB61_04590 [Verrucomicrobiota bacterium]|nr:hypothetical protein [Verrucomicrobiota bacterium]